MLCLNSINTFTTSNLFFSYHTSSLSCRNLYFLVAFNCMYVFFYKLLDSKIGFRLFNINLFFIFEEIFLIAFMMIGGIWNAIIAFASLEKWKYWTHFNDWKTGWLVARDKIKLWFWRKKNWKLECGFVVLFCKK